MTDLVKLLREANIVIRGDVDLSSGEKSEIYFDVKKVYGNPHILNLIGESIANMLGDETCIASMGYGGIPLATSVSRITKLPLAMVRESPKKYGRINLIDGYIPNSEDRVAIIDDVLTTGGSLKKTANVIEETGAMVSRGYVVVKRGETKLLFQVNYLIESSRLL